MGLTFDQPKGEERPAARLTDQHLCIKHGGGGPINSASPNVYVNSLKFARATDTAQCIGNDHILTGSGTVRVNGKPAARIKSKTLHPGYVSQGSNNVLVGGPESGSTLGNPKKAAEKCKELAQGRPGGSPTQDSSNCSIEASRLLMHQNGSDATEPGLLNDAINHGDANPGTNAFDMGGAQPQGPSNLLNRWGVENTMVDQTPANIQQNVADGKGVVSYHNADQLWGTGQNGMGGHAVVPSGMDYDADGKLTNVHTVDSAQSDGCDKGVSPSNYMNSLKQYPQGPVTTKKLW